MVNRTAGWAALTACVGLLPDCQYVSGVNELEIHPAAAAGPDWSCVGEPAPTPTGTLEYDKPVLDLVDRSAITDVTVTLCRKRDELCSEPVATPAITDGVLRFAVDASFDGYIQLESPRRVPGIVELTRPIGSMRELPELSLFDGRLMQAFASAAGATVDPARGHLLFWADDCQGQRSAGVRLDVDQRAANTAQYYVVDGLPSVRADRTAPIGGGGLINLPTGVVVFQAVRADTGEAISPPHSARIREGHVTFVVLEPN